MTKARSPGSSEAIRKVSSETASSTGSMASSRRTTKFSIAPSFQPGRRNVDHTVVDLREALQLGARQRVIRVLERPEPDRLLVDQAADGAVILGALADIGGDARVVQQLVELGVRIPGERQR